MTSSVRLTTAARLVLRLRKVVVSRNGFSTMVSSPHSTPMGAKLMVPWVSLVVTMVSTITGPGQPAAGWWPDCCCRNGGAEGPHRPLREAAGGLQARHGGSDREYGNRARSTPTRGGTAHHRLGAPRGGLP